VIEAESLAASDSSIRVQISRWEKARKLIKLKRGIYGLSEKYQKREIDEFHQAAVLKRPSGSECAISDRCWLIFC